MVFEAQNTHNYSYFEIISVTEIEWQGYTPIETMSQLGTSF